MLNKLKQFASFLNLPVLVMVMSLTVLCFVIFKLLQAYLFPKSSKKTKFSSKDKNGNIKSLSRKKRNKKPKSDEVVIDQKRMVLPVDDEAIVTSMSGRKSDKKPIAPTIEVESVSHLSKKQDKKKGKSKKKKSQSNEADDTTSHSVKVVGIHSIVDEGEWQTVRNKDQKFQRKEKKRQDEIVASVPPPQKTSSTAATTPSLFIAPVFTSIPSTAKDVAPRFARAAGEEWQDGASKRQTVNVAKSTTILNRSPMLPAAAQQSAQQQQSSTKWTPASSASITHIWDNKVATSVGFSSTQDTWSTSKPEANPWTTVKPAGWSGKSSTTAWENTGGPVLDQPDDWVHVTSPSPTSPPLSENWATTSSVYQQAMQRWPEVRVPEQAVPVIENPQKERFHMEPEGLSVSSLDPDDPWNMDTNYEKVGDWSPPEAHWSNPHEEWAAPAPEIKAQPIYFDESSEEERVVSSIPTSNNPSSHSVVGAGSELLQAQNQTIKKARRRRKKKQIINDATSKETVTVNPTIEKQVQVQAPKPSGGMDAIDEIHVNDNWSVSKQSKKKKPRARKAD